MPVGMKLRRNVIRENILKVSRNIIIEQGYNKLSMRAIAREAEFSPSNLYEYFKNKAEILEALADYVSKPLNKSLKESVRKTPEDPLLGLVVAYVDFSRRKKEDFCLMFSRGITEKRKGNDALPLPILRTITSYVEKEIQNNKLLCREIEEAETIAYSLMAFAHGLATLNMARINGNISQGKLADRKALELFLASLRP